MEQEKVNFLSAQGIALEVLKELSPYCSKIEIAGSVRRAAPKVKDIEFVCVPLTEPIPGLLFESETQRVKGFIDAIEKYEKLKGDPIKGRYTQRRHPKNINIDIFIVSEANFGYQLAIRTGSQKYSHEVLGAHWVKAGYHSVDGFIQKNGIIIPTRTEFEFFKLIGLPWVPPNERYTKEEKEAYEKAQKEFKERRDAAKKKFYDL